MAGRNLGLNRKLLAFAASFIVVSGLAISPLRQAVSQAGIKTGSDLLALFDERSPGARPAGALLSTKPAKAPRQYAMPKVRERLPAGIPPAAPPLASASPLGTPVSPLSAVNEVVPALPISGPPLLLPGAPFVPPGGPPTTVPPIGSGPIPPARPPLPPVRPAPIPPIAPTVPSSSPAPVPEPATWLTMIAGFGLTGLMLRRQRRAQQAIRAVGAAASIPAK